MSSTSRTHYSLDEVKRLARSATSCLVGRTTLDRTRADYRGFRGTDAEVMTYIRSVVASLQPDNFVKRDLLVHSKKPGKPTPVDIYGIKNNEGAWYVKFYITNASQLIVTSCHEPERELVCIDGTCVRRSHP